MVNFDLNVVLVLIKLFSYWSSLNPAPFKLLVTEWRENNHHYFLFSSPIGTGDSNTHNHLGDSQVVQDGTSIHGKNYTRFTLHTSDVSITSLNISFTTGSSQHPSIPCPYVSTASYPPAVPASSCSPLAQCTVCIFSRCVHFLSC